MSSGVAPHGAKRVVIAGATGGIGRRLTHSLAARGDRLALAGRNEVKLRSLVDEVNAEPSSVFARAFDVADSEAVDSFVAEAADAFGGLDVLVNLAGYSQPREIAATEVNEYRDLIDANLTGTFLMSRAFLSPDISGRDRLIINVGSMAGIRPNPNAPLYCTAKAAVRTFSQALALQVAPTGVRVTNVAPAGTDTPFWGDRPVDRSLLLSADDVVRVIAFVMDSPPYLNFHELAFESLASSLPERGRKESR